MSQSDVKASIRYSERQSLFRDGFALAGLSPGHKEMILLPKSPCTFHIQEVAEQLPGTLATMGRPP